MEKLNIGEKLQNTETNMTELVEKKVVGALKMTPHQVEKKYSSVLDAETQKCTGVVRLKKHHADRSYFGHNIKQSFGVQGVT